MHTVIFKQVRWFNEAL